MTARFAGQDFCHVGGRYRLVEKLGSGGMSVVFRGYDEILGRQVAVKVLSTKLAGDQGFRERLRQEALAAARLCHPHITGIFDFGESAFDGAVTVPYVVMELNDGESVSRRLARCGPLPWREAVTVAAEVASALATAHARGVVHRDVTPANVMLTGAGAKVVDFGISALIGERDAAPDGSLLGTPAYLAPERLAGGHVLPATDVYALGLLLYRSLTARLPWPAGTTAEALRAHLYADPELLPTLPGMPGAVAALCLRCLVKDPADRPAAADVAHTLGALVGAPVVIPPLPAADADQPAPAWAEATTGAHPTIVAGPEQARPPRVPRPAGAPRPTRPSPVRILRGVRHRVQAAAATAVLMAVLGAGWAAADEPAPVGPAQAAAAGTAPAVGARHPVACRVRYQVRRDSGTAFDAALTVTNTGRRAVVGGRVEFAYPGTQRLAGVAATVSQRGRHVVVRAGTLRPGRAVGVTLRGSYRDANPLPLTFTLAGRSCRVEVLGSTVRPAEPRVDEERGVTTARQARSESGRRGQRTRPERMTQEAAPSRATGRKADDAPARPRREVRVTPKPRPDVDTAPRLRPVPRDVTPRRLAPGGAPGTLSV